MVEIITVQLNTLTLYSPVIKVVEFFNSILPDEVAHYELRHQDLPGMLFARKSLKSQYYKAWLKHF